MNIFFDLDGTVIDSQKRLFKLFCDITGQKFLDFDDYWELKRALYGHNYILANYLGFKEKEVLSFNKAWMEQIEKYRYLELDKLFPFTNSFLKNLVANNINIHIVTARQSRYMATKQLNDLGISKYFKTILVTEALVSKESLVKTSGIVLSEKDIFVGDTGLDIQTAQSLKICSVAVLTGFRNRSMLKKYKPDYIFKDIRGLEIILKDLFKNKGVS